MTRKAPKEPLSRKEAPPHLEAPSRKHLTEKKKLPRGYKYCASCHGLLHIHKYQCNHCGQRQEIKRRKVEIMKNIERISPKSFKLTRALIELDQFNMPPSIEGEVLFPPSEYTPKLPAKKKATKTAFTNTSSPQLKYLPHPNPLTCITSILNDIIFVESLLKSAIQSQSEKITIKAFGLQSLHRVGQIYEGKSLLHYMSNQVTLYQVEVPHHIVSMKSVSNRLGLLTGHYSLLVIDFQITLLKNIAENVYELTPKSHIPSPAGDQFTVLEWCRHNFTSKIIQVLIGTIMGHIYVYDLKDNYQQVARFMHRAHNEAVMALSQCPLSNEEFTIAASGSFDGAVCVWNLAEKSCIYRFQATNRKVFDLLWDPAAKFLLIARDEAPDCAVLTIFFSLIRKGEVANLNDQVELRTVKGSSNSYLISHHQNSSVFALGNSRTASLQFFSFEDLRKNSLNRKSSKIHTAFSNKIELAVVQNRLEVQAKPRQKEEKQQLPVFVITQICHLSTKGKNYIYGTTPTGLLFVSAHDFK